MDGHLAALYRHPVKGFTPEPLTAAMLEAGACFPCDRLYAVENGPSGFDPLAPVHLSKKKFTVLASIPALARVRTAYDETSGVIGVALDDGPAQAFALRTEAGRDGFADWLGGFVEAEDRRGLFRVLETAGPFRFMDDQVGHVSLLNLASVRDLAERLGRPVDPLRFRANLHVEGWSAWSELELAPGAEIRIGEVTARVIKPIVRCVATHVDPATGERDIDLVPALFSNYGRLTCGLYLQVGWGGRVSLGDQAASLIPAMPTPPPEDRAPIHLN